MTRVAHHSKIYVGKYYFSTIVLGLMVSWGESLLIWIPIPFTASMTEILSLNVFAIICGAFTGLITAFIGLKISEFIDRKKKFDRKIHQTSWTFALAVALFSMPLILGGLLGGSTLTQLIMILIISPLIFILSYQYAVLFLFKRKLAGRITFEVFVVIFILIYLFKHPGPPEEVPLSNPIHPHIFLLNVPNFQLDGENGFTLSDLIPEEFDDGLVEFKYASTTLLNKRANLKEIFLTGDTSEVDLLNFIRGYDYYSALFSTHLLPQSLQFGSFDIIDAQTYSLKTRHSLFKFYDRLLPFLNLFDIARKIDGYPEADKLDPDQLNQRMTNMIKQRRGEHSFFIFASYAPDTRASDKTISKDMTAIKSFLFTLEKMGMLKDSKVFITSFSGDNIQKPLVMISSNSVFDDTVIEVPVSQADIGATILTSITNAKPSNGFRKNLIDIANGDNIHTRPIYTWDSSFGTETPARFVRLFPWQLEQVSDTEFKLTNFELDPEGDVNLIDQEPEIFEKLTGLLYNPVSELKE